MYDPSVLDQHVVQISQQSNKDSFFVLLLYRHDSSAYSILHTAQLSLHPLYKLLYATVKTLKLGLEFPNCGPTMDSRYLDQ